MKQEFIKEERKMQKPKNTNLFHFLLLLIPFSCLCTAKPTITSFCGNIRVESPLSLQTSNESSLLSRILLCKSQKLYFRTSVGLFHVSSIDYTAKTLTISHSSCSSALHFISPSLLSAGFPSTPQPNSLLLLNCSSHRKPISSFRHNCSSINSCKALSESRKEKGNQPSSCWFINDAEKLEMGFDPKDLNCSHYNRVYRDPAYSSEGFELGTRISFGIPDHAPKICDECAKPQGNCGVGLRCICHPKECKDKVHSKGVSIEPFGNIFPSLLAFTTMMISFI